MHAAGIICEYNPFHNGHFYHLQETKALTKADAVIALMSGSFVQRGEAAVMDKWARAKCALASGADLVLELPFCYASGSAEYFAGGALRLLAATGSVTHLSFGSESGNIADISSTAAALLNEKSKENPAFIKNFKEGKSYPSSVMASGDFEGLRGSNNILATEYLKAIKKYNLSVIPVTVKRFGSGYNSISENDEFISATAARNIIFTKGLKFLNGNIPAACMEILKEKEKKGCFPVNTNDLSMYILGIIRKGGSEYLKNIAYVSEGIENRIYKAALEAFSFDEIVERVKTKRYITARIKRILISAAIGLTAFDLALFSKNGPAYIRILGANEKGQALIKELKKKTSLPIITKTSAFNPQDEYTRKMLAYDYLSTDIYSLACPSLKEKYAKKDLTTSPIMI